MLDSHQVLEILRPGPCILGHRAAVSTGHMCRVMSHVSCHDSQMVMAMALHSVQIVGYTLLDVKPHVLWPAAALQLLRSSKPGCGHKLHHQLLHILSLSNFEFKVGKWLSSAGAPPIGSNGISTANQVAVLALRTAAPWDSPSHTRPVPPNLDMENSGQGFLLETASKHI